MGGRSHHWMPLLKDTNTKFEDKDGLTACAHLCLTRTHTHTPLYVELSGCVYVPPLMHCGLHITDYRCTWTCTLCVVVMTTHMYWSWRASSAFSVKQTMDANTPDCTHADTGFSAVSGRLPTDHVLTPPLCLSHAHRSCQYC